MTTLATANRLARARCPGSRRCAVGTEERVVINGLLDAARAGRAAGRIWDYEGWDELSARQIQVARDVGAMLPLALSTRAGVDLFAGELPAVASLPEESEALSERLLNSQHTVGYHLRKVFTKLDITSRKQLGCVLPQNPDPGRLA